MTNIPLDVDAGNWGTFVTWGVINVPRCGQ